MCAVPYDLGGAQARVWRVDVAASDGGVARIVRHAGIDVLEELGEPLPASGGTHVVAARDARGGWLDARLVSFQHELRLESEAAPVETSPVAGEVSASVFFSNLGGVADFALYDGQGKELGRQTALREVSSPYRLADSDAEPVVEPLPRACAHVRVITDASEIAPALVAAIRASKDRRNAAFDAPGEHQREAIAYALNHIPPGLCLALTRIAMVSNVGARGMVHGSAAGTVFVNGQKFSEERLSRNPYARLLLARVLWHEAAHAMEHLLNAEGWKQSGWNQKENIPETGWFQAKARKIEYTPTASWTGRTRSKASRAARAMRLTSGLMGEWKRLHRGFVALGRKAKPYFGQDICSPVRHYGAKQVAHLGFMTPYASTAYHDDIADTVAWAEVAPLMTGHGYRPTEKQSVPGCTGVEASVRILPSDYGCQAMRAANARGGVPIELAAVYSKLRIAYGLGMVSKRSFDKCTGGVKLDVPGTGFYRFVEGTPAPNPFTSGMKGAMAVSPKSGSVVFELEAEGTVKRTVKLEKAMSDKRERAVTTLRLELAKPGTRLAEVSWPRGIYRIGVDADYRVTQGDDTAIAATEGFVLVVEASDKRIVGSVVIQKLITDNVLGIPKVPKEPIVVRFMSENHRAP